MARAMRSEMVVNMETAGKYDWKLLTLTCPGKEFRESHTPGETLKLMARSWHKLITALRKYGPVDYLRVVEAQQDGFPHYHVLLHGKGIAPRQTLQRIERLWAKYGFGFVRLNVLRDGHGIRKAIGYVLKYLFKQPGQWDKGTRLHTASKRAMEKPWKSPWVWLEGHFAFNRSGYPTDIMVQVVNELNEAALPWRVDADLERVKIWIEGDENHE